MDPIFSAAGLPRYTQEPLPPYRYLPFRPGMPHPTRDPEGHSYGKEEEYLATFTGADWCTCQPYLYGVDLFNAGYWWEAHEAWEPVWLAAGRETEVGHFIQGLILLAAAQLKRFMAEERGAQLLTESALSHLSLVADVYLGIKVEPLCKTAERCLQEGRGEYPSIRLHF